MRLRASVHRALADEGRLRLVDCLAQGDRTPSELARNTGMSSNLLAFHLDALEEAGLVERRRSEGDSRRRYVRLRPERLRAAWAEQPTRVAGAVVFVCTHNSARSQFAEAYWRQRTGGEVWSAGSSPAQRVHPDAIAAARSHGLDLTGSRPKGYTSVPAKADLVVSVCDRAYEGDVPIAGSRLHWSVPDPVSRDRAAFEQAFADIAMRIEWICA